MAIEDDVFEAIHDVGNPAKVKKVRLPNQILTEDNIEDAINWMKGAEDSISKGIKTLAKFTGGLIRHGAFRSVVTTLYNRTPFELHLTKHELDGGIWTKDMDPPKLIPAFSIAAWSSESEGVGTGTEGMVQFIVRGDDRFPTVGTEFESNDQKVHFDIHWDNPAMGSNSVRAHWYNDQKSNPMWDRLHLPEPDDIADNQAHHRWLLKFDA